MPDLSTHHPYCLVSPSTGEDSSFWLFDCPNLWRRNFNLELSSEDCDGSSQAESSPPMIDSVVFTLSDTFKS